MKEKEGKASYIRPLSLPKTYLLPFEPNPTQPNPLLQVGSLVSVSDVMAWKRDFYEGTPFDLGQGPAAGPYGDPRRFDASV